MEGAIVPLELAEITLPEGHPEGAGPCRIRAYAVRDGASLFLVDTGLGPAHPLIDRLYAPRRRSLDRALAEAGIALGDVTAIVNSHLHFDHCGSNALFPDVPIYVQRAELEAAAAPHYGVEEWIHFPGANYVAVDGDHALGEHTRIVATPGHTPGHQSLVLESPEGARVVVAQAAYRALEFESARVGDAAAAPGGWDDECYLRSRARLLALDPIEAHFSHDGSVWTPPRDERGP